MVVPRTSRDDQVPFSAFLQTTPDARVLSARFWLGVYTLVADVAFVASIPSVRWTQLPATRTHQSRKTNIRIRCAVHPKEIAAREAKLFKPRPGSILTFSPQKPDLISQRLTLQSKRCGGLATSIAQHRHRSEVGANCSKRARAQQKAEGRNFEGTRPSHFISWIRRRTK